MVHNLVKRDREALVRLFYEERAVERDYRQCLVGEELFASVNSGISHSLSQSCHQNYSLI